jgi:hypothetical protein
VCQNAYVLVAAVLPHCPAVRFYVATTKPPLPLSSARRSWFHCRAGARDFISVTVDRALTQLWAVPQLGVCVPMLMGKCMMASRPLPCSPLRGQWSCHSGKLHERHHFSLRHHFLLVEQQLNQLSVPDAPGVHIHVCIHVRQTSPTRWLRVIIHITGWVLNSRYQGLEMPSSPTMFSGVVAQASSVAATLVLPAAWQYGR